MIRFFAVLISFFLFFSEAYIPPYEYRDEENIRFSAVILSDMHTETNSNARFLMDGYTLKGVYSGGRSPDVLAFAGDNTMNGQSVEWFDFYGLVNRYNKGSDVLVAFGNHDFGNTADGEVYKKLSKRSVDSYNYYCRKNIDKVYYSADYGVVKFIVLGSENNAENTVQVITDAQIDWLESELADCAGRNIPAVVINHNPLYGRNGRRSYFGFNQIDSSEKIDSVLQSAGVKIIYVSGHTHFGLSDDSVTSDGSVTYINLPSAGNNGNYDAPEEYSTHGIGMILEIYDGDMVVTFRNFAKGKALEGYGTETAL